MQKKTRKTWMFALLTFFAVFGLFSIVGCDLINEIEPNFGSSQSPGIVQAEDTYRATFYEDNVYVGDKKVKKGDKLGEIVLKNSENKKVLNYKLGEDIVSDIENYVMENDTRFEVERVLFLKIKDQNFTKNEVVCQDYFLTNLTLNDIVANADFYVDFPSVYYSFTDLQGKDLPLETKLRDLKSNEICISACTSLMVEDFDAVTIPVSSSGSLGAVETHPGGADYLDEHKYKSFEFENDYTDLFKFSTPYHQMVQVLLNGRLVTFVDKVIVEDTKSFIASEDNNFTLTIRVDNAFNFYVTFSGDENNKLMKVMSQNYEFYLNPTKLAFNVYKSN